MRTAILFLILIFLVNVFLIVIDVDYIFRIYKIDPILHFSGGFFVAMLFAGYLKHLKIGNPGSPRLKKTLILISVTVFIGVIWEFSEYSATNLFGDYLYQKHGIICCIGNLDDTISDLLMDTLGAIAFVSILLNPFRRFNSQKI